MMPASLKSLLVWLRHVNDAFGTAHRAHASTDVTKFLKPSVGGFLMEKELQYLRSCRCSQASLAAIVGAPR